MFPALWGGDPISTAGRLDPRPRRGGGGGGWRRRWLATLAGGLLASCGGGDSTNQQNADEPSGDFPVKVTKAKFPTEQRLALTSDLVLGVKNIGDEPLPELAFTIETDDGDADGSFQTQIDDPAASNPSRPVWILENKYPRATDEPVPKGVSGGLRRADQHVRLRPARRRRREDDRLEADRGRSRYLHSPLPRRGRPRRRGEGRHRRRRRGQGRIRCHDQRQGAEGDGQRQGSGRHAGRLTPLPRGPARRRAPGWPGAVAAAAVAARRPRPAAEPARARSATAVAASASRSSAASTPRCT